MLDTVVDFCPPSHLPFEPAEMQVLLGASYDGVACAPAMSCRIRYVLGSRLRRPPVPGSDHRPAAPVVFVVDAGGR